MCALPAPSQPRRAAVIAHCDLDAYYCQVEAQLHGLQGQALAVVQYNPFGDLRTRKPSESRLLPLGASGSIIAVSYEARAFGVKRNMSAVQARELCPHIQVVQVPVQHGKADLTHYRSASTQVMSILATRSVLERASVDEAYMDVTQAASALLQALQQPDGSMRPPDSLAGWHVAGWEGKQGEAAPPPPPSPTAPPMPSGAAAAPGAPPPAAADAAALATSKQAGEAPPPAPAAAAAAADAALDAAAAGTAAWWGRPAAAWTQEDRLLAAGAVVVSELRAQVLAKLGFTLSAGVSHTKVVAKLASGLHKPAQQTLVPAGAVAGLLAPLPVGRLRSLGGKFGEAVVGSLGVATIGELAAVPMARLQAAVGVDAAQGLALLARGIDQQEVKERQLPQSIACSKSFRGNTALTSFSAVHHWLQELAAELEERISADRADNARLPSLLTVSIDTHTPTTAASAAGANDGGSGASASAVAAWRAGVQGSSRSVAMRRPTADAMAADALALVKRWAADRSHFKIIGLGLAATKFDAAPTTEASTIKRFFQPQASTQQHQPQPRQPQPQHQQEQHRLMPSSLEGHLRQPPTSSAPSQGPHLDEHCAQASDRAGFAASPGATTPADAAGGLPGKRRRAPSPHPFVERASKKYLRSGSDQPATAAAPKARLPPSAADADDQGAASCDASPFEALLPRLPATLAALVVSDAPLRGEGDAVSPALSPIDSGSLAAVHIHSGGGGGVLSACDSFTAAMASHTGLPSQELPSLQGWLVSSQSQQGILPTAPQHQPPRADLDLAPSRSRDGYSRHVHGAGTAASMSAAATPLASQQASEPPLPAVAAASSAAPSKPEWLTLTIEDIDQDVLAEIPPEMRAEVQQLLGARRDARPSSRPGGRAGGGRRGGGRKAGVGLAGQRDISSFLTSRKPS